MGLFHSRDVQSLVPEVNRRALFCSPRDASLPSAKNITPENKQPSSRPVQLQRCNRKGSLAARAASVKFFWAKRRWFTVRGVVARVLSPPRGSSLIIVAEGPNTVALRPRIKIAVAIFQGHRNILTVGHTRTAKSVGLSYSQYLYKYLSLSPQPSHSPLFLCRSHA